MIRLIFFIFHFPYDNTRPSDAAPKYIIVILNFKNKFLPLLPQYNRKIPHHPQTHIVTIHFWIFSKNHGKNHWFTSYNHLEGPVLYNFCWNIIGNLTWYPNMFFFIYIIYWLKKQTLQQKQHNKLLNIKTITQTKFCSQHLIAFINHEMFFRQSILRLVQNSIVWP